jgi:heme exporter protein D
MTSFLNQGGYAFFVWGAYGMTFALLAAEVIALMLNQRTILARLGRWVRGRASSPQSGPQSGPQSAPQSGPRSHQ